MRQRRAWFLRTLSSVFFATVAFMFFFGGTAQAVNSPTSSISGNGTGGTSPRGVPCDTWVLNGVTGQSVTVYMYKVSMSDPYLHWFNSSGTLLASNDDGAGNLNSVITRTWNSGDYIGASVYSSNNGSYYLASSAGSSWTRVSSSCGGTPPKSNQTITFNNPGTRTFGTSFTLSATASSGLAVRFVSSTPSICALSGTNNTTATLNAAGTCTVTAYQDGNTSFNAASAVTQSFTVAKASQTITFGTPSNQTFHPTNTVAMSASSSSGLAVSFTSQTTGVCTTSGSNVTMVASGTCTIRAAQAGDSNYNAATSIDRSFTISRASQTITFSTLTDRAYSRTTFTLSATTSASGLGVSFASQTTGVCTTSGTNGTTVTMVAVGTCTIRASQAGDTRYLEALSVDRSFTISRASQTITFSTSSIGSKTYGQPAFTVSGSTNATAADGSALAVVFVSSTPDVCSTSGTNGSTVTIVAAGNCTIVASQEGNDLFLAASSVSQNVTVTKKTVTAPNASIASRAYNGTPTPGVLSIGALSGLVGSETLNVTATAADYASASVGSRSSFVTFALTNGSNGGLASNYEIAPVTLSGSITTRPLTVTAASFAKTADDQRPTFTVSASGLVAGESVASATYTFRGTGPTSYGPSTTVPSDTLVGTYSVTPSAVVLAGSASASNYNVSYVAGSYAITHGAAKSLSVPAFSGTKVSGVAFGTQPVVTLLDDGGNTIITGSASTATVTATITSGSSGRLVGVANASAVDGVARFTDLGLAGLVSQTYTITYSVDGLVSATQSMSPTPGAATQLAVTTDAAGRVATAFNPQPVVEIRDAEGNRVTSSTARVTASVSGGTLTGTTAVSAMSGIATFTNLTMSGTVGTEYTLSFSSPGLTTATQPIALQAGPAAKLALTQRSVGSQAGVTFTTVPAVTVQDAAGNPVLSAGSTVTATITQVSGSGHLVKNGVTSTTVTALTNANGVATFDGVGISGLNQTTYRVTYSATVNSVVLATVFQEITVTTGPPTRIIIDRQAAGARSAIAMTTQPRVRIVDIAGNVVTDSSSQKNVTIGASSGSISGATITTEDGYGGFGGLTLSGTAGTVTLTYSSEGLTSASHNVSLTAGAATKLRVNRAAATAVAGSAFGTQPIIEITDGQNNRITNSSVIVTASLTSASSGVRQLLGSTTATAVSGLATFQTLGVGGTAASFDLEFTASNLTSATQSSLVLGHGSASKIVLTDKATSASSGVTLDPETIAEIRDAYDNVVTSESRSIRVRISTGGTLTGTQTKAATNGVVEFTDLKVTARTGTTVTLTYSGSNNGVNLGWTAATQTLNIGQGEATTLAIDSAAAGTASGATFTGQPKISVRDAFGNLVTSLTGSVRADITAGTDGALLGTQEKSLSSGVATFTDLGIEGTAGVSYTVTYSYLPAPSSSISLTSATQAVTVTPGAPSAIVVTTQPSLSVASGTALAAQPVMRIVDAKGNTVTSSQAAVTASIASGSASLLGTTTVNANRGVVTFGNLSLVGSAGSNTLRFTMTGGISVDSTSVSVTPGAPNKVVVTNKTEVQGGSAPSGGAFEVQPVVVVRDAWDNTITSGVPTITTTASDGAALVAGTSTVASGERTFAGLGLTARVGTHGVTFGATVNGVPLATDSVSLAVTPGEVSQLLLDRAAAGTASGALFTTQPIVKLLDSANNLVTTATDTVTASVTHASDDDGALVGTAALGATSGVANFSGIGISGTAGVTYTLNFAVGSATVSQNITVSHGAVDNENAELRGVADSAVGDGEVRSGVAFTTQPRVTLRDTKDNTVLSSSDTVLVTTSAGQLVGPTSVVAVRGIATFGGLSLVGTAGTQATLTFARVGSPNVALATQTVTIRPGLPVRLSLDTSASGAAAGAVVATAPTVTLRDSAGNVVAPSSPVTLTATISAGGTLEGRSVTMASSSLVLSSLKLLGRVATYTLTYSVDGLGSVEQSIDLTYGAAARILVDPTVKNIAVASDSEFSLGRGVRIADVSGNTVANSTITVDVTTDSGVTEVNGISHSGPPSVSAVSVSAVEGIVPIVKFKGTSSDYTVTYSATGLDGDTQQLRLSPGAARKLSVEIPGAGSRSGAAFVTQPEVAVQDSVGNLVVGNSTSVRAFINRQPVSSTSGVLGMSSAANRVAATDGIVRFTNLGITGPTGSYTIGVTAAQTTDNLVHLDAGLSYSGSGVQWANLGGSTNTATLVNSPTYVAASGATPAAFTFAGGANASAPHAVLPSGFADFRNGLTIQATVDFGSVNTWERIVDFGNGPQSNNIIFSRRFDSNDLMFEFWGGVDGNVVKRRCTAAGIIESGFQNYAVSVSSLNTDCKIYKNGIEAASYVGLFDGVQWTVTSSEMPANVPRTTNYIGKSHWSADQPFAGSIRDLMIYNAALDAPQILANSLGSTSFDVDVVPGTVTQVSLQDDSAASTAAAGASAGQSFMTQPVVRLRDSAGNHVTTGTGNVTVTLVSGAVGETTCAAPSGAVLSGVTTVSAESGVATFSGLSLAGTAGTYCLEYASTGRTASVQTLSLDPGPVASLSLGAGAASAAVGTAAGSEFTTEPKVALLDASGNLVTSSQAEVTMSLTTVGSTGSLVGGTDNEVSVTAIAGYATFASTGITGRAGTTYTITYASDDVTPVSQNITVTQGPATQLALTTNAARMRAGLAFGVQPVVELRDAGGNVVTDDERMIRVGAASGIFGDATKRTENGVAAFSGTTFAGTASTTGTSYTLTYEVVEVIEGSTSVVGSIGAATQEITAYPGLATGLSLARTAADEKSGSAFQNQPAVSLVDTSYNPVDGISAIVTASIDCGGTPSVSCAAATLVGSVSKPLENGTATFTNLGISGIVGSYTIKYSATIDGQLRTTQGAVTVIGGDATRMELTSAQGTAVGVVFSTQPSVTFRDDIGNLATVPSGTYVRAAIDQVTIGSTSSGSLEGTTTSTVSAGVASFGDLAPLGVAGQAYRVSYTAYDADEVEFAAFTPLEQTITLTAGLPHTMTIVQDPGGARSDIDLLSQPVIELRDKGGNLASSGSVTLSLTSGPQGVTLADALDGTKQVDAVGGVVTFSGLKLTGTAGGYMFTFTPSNAVAAQTVTVSLEAGAPAKLLLSTPATVDETGAPFTVQPVVSIADAQDNVIDTVPTAVTATLSGANGRLVGATTASTVGGSATFVDLGIAGRTGVSYSVRYSATVDSTDYTVDQTGMQVLAGAPAALEITEAATSATPTTPVVARSGVAFASHTGGAPVTITVVDAGGNTVTTSTALVTASVSTGAELVGTVSVNAASGVATFTDLGLSGVSGTRPTITFSVENLPEVSQIVEVATGPASQLQNDQLVAGAPSGSAVVTPPKVSLRDSGGNLVTTSGVTVGVTGSSGALLSGTTSVTTTSGVADFTGLVVTGTMGAEYTLTFDSSSLAAVDQTVVAQLGLPSKVGIVDSPVGTESGVSFTTQPVVVIQDAGGNTVASSSATVTATVAQVNDTGALVGTTEVAAVGGVARFTNLGISGVDGQSYTVSFGAPGLAAATVDMPVTTGPARQLIVDNGTVPEARSGLPFGTAVSVSVRDSGGNVVTAGSPEIAVTITGGGGATLVGATTATATNGVATFTGLGVSGTAGQTPTLTFSLVGVDSATLVPTVSAGPAAKLSIAGYENQSVLAGVALGEAPRIRVEDSGGNLVSSFGDDPQPTVTATITPISVAGNPTGELIGPTTSQTVGGVATFSDLGVVGVEGRSYTVTYTATVGNAELTSASEQFTVSTGPARTVDLSTASEGTASGAEFTTQPVLTVRDAGGNVVTTQTGQIRASISQGGSLVGTVTRGLSAGVADFALNGTGTRLGITGTADIAYTVTYTLEDSSNVVVGGVNPATQSITVTVGAPARLSLTQPAVGAISGTAFTTQPVVTVQDTGGNTVTSSSAAVVASVTQVTVGGAATGSLSGAISVVAADGVATFTNVALSGRTTASYVVTYTAADLPAGSNTVTQSITPSSGSAATLNIVSSANGARAGAVFSDQPVVEILDAAGNRALTSTARITLAVNEGSLIGATFVDAVEGLATFSNVGLTATAANYTLTYSSSGLTDTQQAISVAVGDPTTVVLTTQSVGTAAGRAFTTQPAVELRDAGGNLVSSGDGSSLVVTATVAQVDVAGVLTGSIVGTATAQASGGAATFGNVGLGGIAGVDYTVSYGASFAGQPIIAATQVIRPTPGTPVSVGVQRAADGAVVGQAFTTQPRLSVLDAYGNIVTAGSSTIAATISDGATLVGTATRGTVEGVAVFTNLGARGTSGRTYTVSYALAGYTPTTQEIELFAGAPARLVVSRASAGAVAGEVFATTPRIEVKDVDGNLVTTSSAAITARVTQIDGTGALTGSTTSALNGVASFPSLTLTGRADTSYTITYSALGLLPATETVTLGLGAPTSLEIITPFVGNVAGEPFVQQPRVAVKDPGGNLVTTSGMEILAQVSRVDSQEGGALTGVATVPVRGGVAAFDNLGVEGVNGVDHRITFALIDSQVAVVGQDVRVVTGPARALQLTRPSVGTTIGARFATQPRVSVVDAAGNVVTSSTATVTASISSGGTLTGQVSRAPVNGVVSYTDLRLGGTENVTYVVTYASPGLAAVTQEITATPAQPGNTPVFSAPVRTADGFRVSITNFDSEFTYTGAATQNGRVTIGSTGIVTVGGLASNVLSTLTVTTSREGYTTESRSISERASLGPALTPDFGTIVPTEAGFEVPIRNFDSAYVWRATATGGGVASITSTGRLIVSRVAGGVVTNATVFTTRAGFNSAQATTNDVTTLLTGRLPLFGTSTRTIGGFEVQITNHDADFTWTATATSGGEVTVSGSGLVTVAGLADGTSANVLVVTSQSGYTTRSGSVTGRSLEPALEPALSGAIATDSGWTMQVTNFDADYTWALSTTQGTASLNRATGAITVTGVDTATALVVSTSRNGYRNASTSVSLAVASGIIPVFGSAEVDDDNTTYTVPIVNHDPDFTWVATSTRGQAIISDLGVLTVSAIDATVTVTASRRGYSTHSATYTYSAVPGLEPILDAAVPTLDGFTVDITNYDANFTWVVSATAGGTAVLDTTVTPPRVTVTGLPRGTTSTLNVSTRRADYASASSQATAQSTPLGARNPEFGAVTRTSDGFTVQISNHDPAWVWLASAGSANAEVSRTGLVTVSDVEPGGQATLSITSRRDRYADGSASQIGEALPGGGLIALFDPHVAEVDGFTVQVANHDTDYSWAVVASNGLASINETGRVTVTGLDPEGTATVTVTTSRTGRATATSTFIGGARRADGLTATLRTGRTPVFGSVSRTADGFTAQITNHSTDWTWTGQSSRGTTVTVSSTGLVAVTGLSANTTDTVVVRTSRDGYATGAAAVTGTSLVAGTRATNLLSGVSMIPLCPHGSPDLEGVESVGDLDQSTKYSCFTAADRSVAPYVSNSIGFATGDLGDFIATGITFTAAADSPDRDPLTYTLFGCWAQNDNCSVIASNDSTGLTVDGDPVGRGADGVRTLRNTRAFNFYRVVFGSVRSDVNLVQIGEVQLTGRSGVPAGLTPALGIPETTSTGFTVQVTNFSRLYEWSMSVSPTSEDSPVRVAISDTGLIRVSNLLPASEATLRVTTTRAGYTSHSADVTVTTPVGAALVPELSTVIPTVDGLTAVIENYDTPGYTWTAEASTTTPDKVAGTATIASTGVVTVAGASPGADVRLTVSTTRARHLDGSAFVESTVLQDSAPIVLRDLVRTAVGFTLSIENSVDDYLAFVRDGWEFDVSAAGAAEALLNEATGVITVSNLGPGVRAELRVVRSRDGYAERIATRTEGSIARALVPQFGVVESTDTGFTVLVVNFDNTWTWSVSSDSDDHDASIDPSGLVSVVSADGADPDADPVITVEATKAGHALGRATVKRVLTEALNPVFGEPQSTSTGFNVDITNHSLAWNWQAMVEPNGVASVGSNGIVTVTGVAPGVDTTLTVTSERSGYAVGSTFITYQRAVLTGLTPGFATPIPLVGGFTAQITNYDPLFAWSANAVDLDSAVVSVSPSGLVSVSGLADATPVTVEVSASRAGYSTSSASFVGSARRLPARVPTYGSPSPGNGGFTVQITNHDPAWAWSATVDNNATASVSDTGLLTVVGAPQFTFVSATVTASREGYVPGVSTVRATTAPGAPLVPRFGMSISTTDGYVVPLRNFDPRWTWIVSSETDGVAGTIDQNGDLTVTGADPGVAVTVSVTTQRPGFTAGEAQFTAVSRQPRIADLTPRTITHTSRTGGLVGSIATLAPHGFRAGDRVIVSGVGEGFDGIQTVSNDGTATIGAGTDESPTVTLYTLSFASPGDDAAWAELSTTGFVDSATDVSLLLRLSPEDADAFRTVINVPHSVAEDGSRFDVIAAMTEEIESGYPMVRIEGSSPQGENITTLTGAIRILFDPPAIGAIPVSSSDNGRTWQAIPLLASPELPENQRDGYFVNDDGTVWIFTRHLSMFGMLSEQEVPLNIAAASTQLQPGETTALVVSGGVGDGDVDVVVSTPETCSLSDGVVTAVADGTCTIVATKGASGRYIETSGSLDITVRTPPPPPPSRGGGDSEDDALDGGDGSADDAPSTDNGGAGAPPDQPAVVADLLPPGIDGGSSAEVPSGTSKDRRPSDGESGESNDAAALERRVAEAEKKARKPRIPGVDSPAVGRDRPVAVVEGDKDAATTLKRALGGKGMIVEGEGFTLEIRAYDPDGRLASVDDTSRLVVRIGDTIAVKGSGFAPNTIVTFWLFDGEIALGEATTDEDGNFEIEFPLPEGLAPGDFTLQMNGVTVNGELRTANVSVVVGDGETGVDKSQPQLEPAIAGASSGSFPAGMGVVLLLVALLLALMAWVVISQRLRTRR